MASASRIPGLASPLTILFIDDNPAVADSAAAILRKAGFRVVIALDAIRAQQAAERERNRIDLIVADVGLDPFNGRELVAELRENGLRAPVLFISGSDAAPDLENERFLAKPWDARQLLQAVTEAIAA